MKDRNRYVVRSLDRIAPNNHGPVDGHGGTPVGGEDGSVESFGASSDATSYASELFERVGEHIVVIDGADHRTVWERAPIAAAEQLRPAAEALPKAAEGAPGEVTGHAASLEAEDVEVGAVHRVSAVENVPVPFVLVKRTDGPAWRFSGSLWVDSADVFAAGGLPKLPARLKMELGPMCVEVEVKWQLGDRAFVVAFFRP